jgi:hypothetical protein
MNGTWIIEAFKFNTCGRRDIGCLRIKWRELYEAGTGDTLKSMH